MSPSQHVKTRHALPGERDIWGTCMLGVHVFEFAADLATSLSDEMSCVTFFLGNFRLLSNYRYMTAAP